MLEGSGVCRLTDKKMQNHKNTADLAGNVQQNIPNSAAYTAKRKELDHFMGTDKKAASTLGDKSTAAALRDEIATGKPVKGKWHYKKAKELANGYKNRDADYEKEKKNNQITKAEAQDLQNDTTEGYARNTDAVADADKVSSPPWPT